MNNEQKSEFGLVGLGVMGKSLALNLAGKGVRLSVFNRHVSGKEEDVAKDFVATHREVGEINGFDQVEPFLDSLQSPKILILMVNAGHAVDDMINNLVDHLDSGDVIIDGGNSHYHDTVKRINQLQKRGIDFLGCGISGGEEGARKGPSIMPGGSHEAYRKVGRFLEIISARDKNGVPCCAFIGKGGAGHFVKMVHNGIEYADMQLIAETYHVMRYGLDMEPTRISDVFTEWSKGDLGSYLLEITSDILRVIEGDQYLIDHILDAAGQKGTGGWSTNAALDLGKPFSTISEAVMARNLSGMKQVRIDASKKYSHTHRKIAIDQQKMIELLKKAYRAARIINHAIGFDLMREASILYTWKLDLAQTARIWTNGCIIRSKLMEHLNESFHSNPDLHLLLHSDFVKIMKEEAHHMNEALAQGIRSGFALPVLSAAASYFNGFVSEQSSANIIQAQRDYFGAHTYKRKDAPSDQSFHTDWKSRLS